MTRPEAKAAFRGPAGDRRLERLDELTARLSILAGEPLSLRAGPNGWGQDVRSVGNGVAIAGGSPVGSVRGGRSSSFSTASPIPTPGESS